MGLDWRQSLIIGAVVSSTDAAAVFSVLRNISLPKRVTGVLEAESGFNDAPVVILVVAFSAAGPIDRWYQLVGEIALELAIGAAIGIAVGWIGAYGLKHMALPASGLYPIAVMAIAVGAYAAGAMAHGSGFLAVYIASLFLGNAKLPHRPATRGFAEGLGWIAQIGLFVLLGLLVTPHELGDDILPAVVIGLFLTLVARPASVMASLVPFRVPWREQALMSWAGLRGAVPIVLATIPMVAGVDDSKRIFNIVFVLVIIYTLVQGPTLPWVARTPAPGGHRRKRYGRPGHRVGAPGTAPGTPALRGHPARLPDARRRSQRTAAARAVRPSPWWCVRAPASCPCRRPCCGEATSCWSWRPIRCATPRRTGCGRSAGAGSWPAGCTPGDLREAIPRAFAGSYDGHTAVRRYV